MDDDVLIRAALEQLIASARVSDIRAVAVIGVILIVFFIRRYGEKYWPALATSRGGALLAIGVGVGGAIVSALRAGHGLDVSLCLDGVINGIAAAGGWVTARRIFARGHHDVS